MRVRLLLAAVVGTVFLSAPALAPVAAATDDSSNRVVLTLFYGEGCPFCANERAFLVGLQERQPLLDVVAYEVWHDEGNLRLFRETAAAFGIDAHSVPTTFLGETVWVGFDSVVQQQIEDAVAALAVGLAPEVPNEPRSTSRSWARWTSATRRSSWPRS